MKYDFLKWLSDINQNNSNGDSYAHVSYKRVENGKTVEEYEKNFINGEPVEEERKQVCECNKNYQALKEENKELKERVYDLEKENKELKNEVCKARDENEKLSTELKCKREQLENITKNPVCGGFMISDEDMKKGNIEEMFRQAGEYMQNILNSRLGK